MFRKIDSLKDLTKKERRLLTMVLCAPYIISIFYFIIYPFIHR